LAIATAVVFVISSAFPVAAGVSKNLAAFPEWWGPLDVGIAVLLGLMVIVVMALAEGKVNTHARDTSYRTYRVLIHGILAMLVVFFVAGDRITGASCLTGFAWRSWLLLYSLPAWFTLFGAESGRGQTFDGSSKLEGTHT
jgi:hypothetical protein